MYQLQQANLTTAMPDVPTFPIGLVVAAIVVTLIIANLILTIHLIRSNRILRRAIFAAIIPAFSQQGGDKKLESFSEFYQKRKENEGCDFTDLNSPTPSGLKEG